MKVALRRFVFILSIACLPIMACAFSSNGAAAQSGATAELDTSQLPRVGDAKVIFSNPTTTIFTTTTSVQAAADATHKMLSDAGWQIYAAPFTATAANPETSIATFKKGPLGLTVFIGIAPGQGNATSVQYGPGPLSNDLPFPKDGTAIEYDPHRPLLMFFTSAPLDKTLTYYREQLGSLGWSLWSAQLGDKQPTGGGPGELTQNGAHAYYVQDGKRPLMLSLQHADGKLRLKLEGVSMSVLEAAHKSHADAARRAKGLPLTTVESQPKPAPATPAKPSPEDKTFDAAMNLAQELMRQELEKVGKSGGTPAAAGAEDIPRVRADSTVPIPLPETAADVDHDEDDGEIEFDSQSNVGSLAAFYRAEMKKLGWREQRSVINRSNMVVLNFSKAGDELSFTIMKFGNQTRVTGKGSVLVAQRPQQPQAPAQQAEASSPSPSDTGSPPLPMPSGADGVDYDNENGSLNFTAPQQLKAVIEFYRSEMKRQGWQESQEPFINPRMAILRYLKDDDGVSITMMASGNATDVSAEGSVLKSASAKNAPPSADDLIVEEVAGLPVPKARESAESEKSPMRKSLKAQLRLALPVTLDFYRRELAKRNWKETGTAVVSGDQASLTYASPEGPATLKIGRRSGYTIVDLALKIPAEAARLGLQPKPGQAKVVVGNMLKSPAEIKINNKTIKVGPEIGADEPNGPTLDLPPGKYKATLRIGGKPAQGEDVELAAEETWGLIVGPGGLLALQVY
ncbi:MAG: hypothetical protein VX871_10765 [Pseudomonadota bacterium]|nr:hypothetical protein [Pseudomonadota bacterium]